MLVQQWSQVVFSTQWSLPVSLQPDFPCHSNLLYAAPPVLVPEPDDGGRADPGFPEPASPPDQPKAQKPTGPDRPPGVVLSFRRPAGAPPATGEPADPGHGTAGGSRRPGDVRRVERLQPVLAALAGCTDPVERRRLQGLVVTEHLPVAKAIAARYRGRGVDHDDLEQLAYLGLVKAAARWLPDRSEDFLQFAVPTIAGEIKRYFRDHTWLVRPTRRIGELRAAIGAAERDTPNGPGPAASDAVIGHRIGASAAEVREARTAGVWCRPPSLDATDGPGLNIALHCGADDPALHAVDDTLALKVALQLLTDREREVVRLRFDLDLSQARIGQLIGVSQMQVSRILKDVTAKLRQHWPD